ncbi:MAG: hypothetical protein DPW21_00710 [Anaerolineae bacterium]|nr:DUF2130 domain-containing protein [Chloroflexi bacterium CFX2]MCQ3945201.1 hypothetical protein [Anaerolineae bacterium]MCZ7547544.1 DUF2130 domain-containing protein [Anaerolineales bacterium]GER79114.1 conserved hypothetical protein [Candidatus Denitrolinea symbiosum]HPO85044.1 DUF2130 domain-containing protein [Candidatus Hydrogenedentota bacterium]
MAKQNSLTCPVCGKPLTQTEYDKALGLWDEKQKHIKHLEAEQKKLKEQAKKNKQIVEAERKKLREKEQSFKAEQAKLRAQTKKALADQAKKTDQAIKKERALAERRLKQQRKQVESSLKKQMQAQVKEGVAKGIEQQKAQLKKQEAEFKKQQAEITKTKNKMAQLEKSLKLSADKYQQANAEIKKLKEQIQKGITPQIEGLLEEGKLLATLQELFPHDRFEHPGKGGDILQFVIEQGQQIGIIVYECKKVKVFDKKHIDQAKTARRVRGADFAVLVTNVFPSKKQFYFVEKTVFVISPVSLEPITQTLRDSLVRIYMLRLSNEAKSKAVQQVYDFLSSNDYSNKVNDLATQLIDLGKELKTEISSHRRVWEKRYKVYKSLFIDIGVIDHKLRSLIRGIPGKKPLELPPPQQQFVDIEELQN